MSNVEEDFESIDLSFDDSKDEKKSTQSEMNIDDLNLEDVEDGNPLEVKDDLVDEIKEPKETKVIKTDVTPSVPVVKKETPKNELDDLEIDLGDEPSTPTPVKQEEKPVEVKKEIPSDNIDDLNIDLDEDVPEKTVVQKKDEVEPDLVPPPASEAPVLVQTEPKKRGRKPKATVMLVPAEETPGVTELIEEIKENTKEIPTVGKSEETSEMVLEPLFDISKINESKKYQTRAVSRTKEQLDTLGNILKMQGQLEPIHLHKEGPEYFVVVGFGRFEALKSIGSKTIKAIIHQNLNDSELIKLSTGTNENRLELTEWDKIASVGKFAKEHPEIPKDGDPTISPCLTSIFGYNKSQIYSNCEIYSFFCEREEFVKYFKHNPLPQFMFRILYDSRKHIDEDEKFIEFIKSNKNLGKKDFDAALMTFLANERIVKNIVEKEEKTEDSGIDIGQDTGTTKVDREIDKLVEDLSNESKDGSKTDVEKIKKVSELLADLTKNITAVEDSMKNLLAVDQVKQYIDNSRVNTLGKKITGLSKMYLKIAS